MQTKIAQRATQTISKLLNSPILSSFYTFQLRALPERINTRLVCTLSNHLLLGQDFSEQLHQLNNNIICITVQDINKKFYIKIECGRLFPANLQAQPDCDVCISGNAEDFKELILRNEDPDTLFFRRRLQLEGNVETGLLIKNLMDSIDYDWSSHFDSILHSIKTATLHQ